MADEKEVILFEASFDAKAAEAAVVSYKKELIELKKTRADLDKSYKEGKISIDEYAKATNELDKASANASKGLRDQAKAIENYNTQTKAAEGSLTQMRARLSALSSEYADLSKEQRENSAAGKQLQMRIKSLSDELKEQESAIGDNRRNVGNYIKDLTIAGVNIGDMADKVQYGSQAFQVVTKSIMTMRGGLIALGAVPIIGVLTGLYLILTKSQGAMDKLAQYFKAGELALNQLGQGFMNVTRIVGEAFTSWEKFSNLLPDLLNNVERTQKAMGEAARAGMEIAAANQRIEDSEIRVGVSRAQNRREVERLKLVAEDVTKSQSVRAAAAKRAFDIENASMREQTKLQRERIANLEREQQYGNKTREDARKLADERIRLAEIEEESFGKQTELNNSLNTIRQEGIQKAKEAAAYAAQEAVAQAERALIMARQKGQETLSIEEELIRRKGALESVDLKKGSAQRKLVEAQTNAEILELRINHLTEISQRTLNIQKSQISSSLALAMRGSKEVRDLQVKELQRQTQEQLLALEADYKKKKIKAEEYEEAKADIVLNGTRAVEDVRRQFDQAEAVRFAELSQLAVQTDLDEAQDKLAIRRNLATESINIEEERLIAVLKLEEMADEDRQIRERAIRARAEAQRKEVYRQIQADAREDARAQVQTRINQIQAGTREELELQRKLLKIQMDVELANTELGEYQQNEIKAKYRKMDEELERDFQRKRVSFVIDSIAQSTQALSSVFEAQLQRATNTLDQQEKAAVASAGLTADAKEKIEEKFQKKREKLEKEAAEKRRKIATVENLINIARGVVQAQLNPFPLNLIQTALVVATGAAQQAVIASQKFAKGGVLQGPSHQQGGIKLFGRSGAHYGEAEGNEIILTRKVYENPRLRAAASAINQAAGGVPIGPPTTLRNYRPAYHAAGGVLQSTQVSAIIDYNKLAQAMAAQPAPIVAVGDIRRGVSKAVHVEQRADL